MCGSEAWYFEQKTSLQSKRSTNEMMYERNHITESRLHKHGWHAVVSLSLPVFLLGQVAIRKSLDRFVRGKRIMI